ncbi:hypothetical protein Haur_0274 [Herpetosiphon aurantiacus DSM 785]|uniref:Uncharacterized protein n=2 Tax=Herpetosiphon TaxID=64 RepID=A9B7F3_HERA2|nr:hypothetical protein Haur_0274 [Herpetosiphon aurantiacus DSM 785]
MVIGVLFTCGGLVTTGAGIFINRFVAEQLRSQQITTPADASIPNAPVTGIATALSMAALIQHHAADSSNGLSYAQMGRFAVASGDPSGTNTVDAALKDAKGQPVANQARTTQLTAAGLVTSLSLSAMALGASYGAMALGLGFFILGLIITGLGYALRGLITPEVAARFGIQPVSV